MAAPGIDTATTPRDVLDAHVALFRHAQVRAPALLAGFRELTAPTNSPVAAALTEEALTSPEVRTWLDQMEPGRARRFTSLLSTAEGRQSAVAELTSGAAHESMVQAWCGELATMLFDARTYQVTRDMGLLAAQLTRRGLDAQAGFTVDKRELPHPWGFVWLDDLLALHAENIDGDGELDLAVRAFAWGSDWGGDPWVGPGVWFYAFGDAPAGSGCPLAPAWQGKIAYGDGHGYETADEIVARFLVMLWRLLDMEITSVRSFGSGDRQLDKQARRSIRHDQVNVVSLRRPKHQPSSGEHRHVDWSCAWIVRGHLRRYAQPIKSGPNAGQTMVWVRPYIKGPDGAPLKSSEVLYLLQH